MRLLSLAPSNTEILYALGVGDQIIGVTSFCDYPEEAKIQPKVGGWTTPLVDEIKELLRPDLIFTSIYLPPELQNWKGPGKIIHVAPKSLAEIYQSIKNIGKKVQKEEEAKKIIEDMKKGFNLIKDQSGNPPAPIQSEPTGGKQFDNRSFRVYMEEWPVPPMTSGNWVPELVEIAGGISFAKAGRPSAEFDFTKLQDFDPDVMIFHWCGYAERFNEKLVRSRTSWSKLRAIKNDKLFVIDDSLLNRPGPRLVDGAKQIQKILNNINKA